MTPRAGAIEAGRGDEGWAWLALPGHAFDGAEHGVRLPAVGATGARLSPGATRVALGGVGNCWYGSRCTAEA